jgi:cellulase/cellobiase CelA1
VETQCLADDVAKGFADGGERLDTLLVSLVKTAHFLERKADPDVAGDPDPGSGGAGGAGQGGSGQGGTGQGGSTGGPVMSDLAVTVHQDSQWQAGYCDTVTVQNPGSGSVTWEIAIDVQGTITDLWNAKSAPDGAKTKFVGVDYNATLGAGESVSFGFCASL